MSYTEILQAKLTGRTITQRTMLVVGLLLLVIPVVTTPYVSFLFAQYYLFAILALSLGLIWGYAGILSFGQAAFFGLGAYLMAWSYQYVPIGNPAYIAILGAIIVPALLAAGLGYFLFYSDVRDVYFVIITLAISVILEQLAVSVSSVFGGFNGLFLPRMSLSIPGLVSYQLSSDRVFYYLVLFLLISCYVVSRKIVKSDFGDALVAIRENEERTKSLGYNTAKYKTIIFSVSGAIAGIAGAFYATLAEFVAPPLTGFQLSTEVVIWVAVGGRQYLLGAIIGGILVNGLSTVLSSAIADRYILILGLVFIVVVMSFREGLVGFLTNVTNWGENDDS